MCRSFISTNDFQNRFATGDAYGVSVLVQCIDFHVKGYFIGSDYVTEMFKVSQQIVARTYEPLLLYLEVGLIYLIFSTVLTKLQSIGEKKLSYYGRKEG